MAKLTVAGTLYEIAPYKIGALRRIAPLLERIKEREGQNLSTTEAMDTMVDVIGVLALGLQKLNSDLSAEYLEDALGLPDQIAVNQAFFALMRESGLGAPEGEVPPPLEGASLEA